MTGPRRGWRLLLREVAGPDDPGLFPMTRSKSPAISIVRGTHNVKQIAEIVGASRQTIYRALAPQSTEVEHKPT